MKILPWITKAAQIILTFATYVKHSKAISRIFINTSSFYPPGNKGMVLRAYELMKGIEK